MLRCLLILLVSIGLALLANTSTIFASFSQRITRQAVQVHTTDWQAPSITTFAQKGDTQFSLTEQLFIDDFVLVGKQQKEFEVAFQKQPLGISFWVEYVGEKSLLPEVQLRVFIDESLMYQLSPLEGTPGERALIHAPLSLEVTGRHVVKFVSDFQEGSTLKVSGISTTRAFLAEDMELLAVVDEGVDHLQTTSGQWRQLSTTTWEYLSNSKEAHSFVSTAKDVVGNTTQFSQFFWQPDSQLEFLTFAQESTPTEAHVLVSTTNRYSWRSPVWLSAEAPLRDLETVTKVFPLKRYQEPESVWVDTPTLVKVQDMFGNTKSLGLLSLQE